MLKHVMVMLSVLSMMFAPTAVGQTAWRDDPAWYDGKAEWALYEAERTIYGEQRQYETVIFTNKEHVDPETTTKAEDWRDPNMIEMFKHTISQIIPTENYDYRFLTSGYVRTDNMRPYKLMSSSQEDCGTSFREFIARDDRFDAVQFCYFPESGRTNASFDASGRLAFHDLLVLTLRDYPFDAEQKPRVNLQLVPSQENNRQTTLEPSPARVEYIGREMIDVPFGTVDAHHLRVRHAEDGGATESQYWFAADPKHRHVMVQYHGPHGVKWRLKRLDWWASWEDPRPE